MSKFDPRRDPPYFAVLLRTTPPGMDAGQFLDAGERMIGLAAAEPGFLGIEELRDDEADYTVCYWDRADSLKRWRGELQDRIPPKLNADDIVCFEGCLWHWLEDVFDARSRADEAADNVVVAFGGAAA